MINAGPAPALLAVAFQHLIAGRAYLGTILLQTSQNDEIALIHQRAAEAADVARAGLLLFRGATALLLGERAGGKRNRHERDCEENFTHHLPSLSRWEIPAQDSTGLMATRNASA